MLYSCCKQGYLQKRKIVVHRDVRLFRALRFQHIQRNGMPFVRGKGMIPWIFGIKRAIFVTILLRKLPQ